MVDKALKGKSEVGSQKSEVGSGLMIEITDSPNVNRIRGC